MRTTLNLDDDLMRAIKRRAADTGRTMTELVDEALRQMLSAAEQREHQPKKLRWLTVEGRIQPGVDLDDRESLYDLMDSG